MYPTLSSLSLVLLSVGYLLDPACIARRRAVSRPETAQAHRRPESGSRLYCRRRLDDQNASGSCPTNARKRSRVMANESVGLSRGSNGVSPGLPAAPSRLPSLLLRALAVTQA
ncbi:hypothetical protein DMC30DRAFT_390872 [Rhodotorula diobovata]|uniref:Secreted protein n=1 Tax=Rhodotorula diobovata TaxID=5288 RepID=A0A5C5G2X9_9BASI|nr:hypothetical protein DMC30DRAFT_390872 [Rhodotorula diobovata]